MMTAADVLPVPEPTIPNIAIPGWAWIVVAVAAFVMYLVTLENGVMIGSMAGTLHEFFHDGRHFAGVPCH